ncbi:MAG: LPS export ABC transporter periplasmic protein LptC [Pseudomonadota bacterium]
MRRARAERLDAVAGYSLLIRWVKIILPIAALLLIAAIFLVGRSEDTIFSPEELASLGAGMQLENPRFTGTTETGDPFVLRAVRAIPDGPSPNEIALEEPAGTLTLSDGQTVDGESRSGLMIRDADELTLTDEVVITTSDGYRAETDQLIINLEAKGAVAPGAVRATGPNGSIEAGRFRVEAASGNTANPASGLILYFDQGVRVVFIPEEAR